MNKLIVRKNIISDDEGKEIDINNNKIIFKQNGDYSIEYIDSTNINLTIILSKNVTINLFEYSNNKDIKIKKEYQLNENATLFLYKFYHNTNTTEDIIFNLNGQKAKLNYCFSNITPNEDRYNIVVNHNAKNTYSNILNSSVALNNARIIFNIDSVLPKGNTECYLNQDTRIINIGDNNCVIKPNMYIEENDVTARHASIIGKFDEEEIFYLMTRGIEYDKAIKLLIKGLIFSNLVIDIEKREKILNIINNYWR